MKEFYERNKVKINITSFFLSIATFLAVIIIGSYSIFQRNDLEENQVEILLNQDTLKVDKEIIESLNDKLR